jgi:hypothetical protein
MVSWRPARTLQGSGRMDAEGSQADRRKRLNDQEGWPATATPSRGTGASFVQPDSTDGSHIQSRQTSKALSSGHE